MRKKNSRNSLRNRVPPTPCRSFFGHRPQCEYGKKPSRPNRSARHFPSYRNKKNVEPRRAFKPVTSSIRTRPQEIQTRWAFLLSSPLQRSPRNERANNHSLRWADHLDRNLRLDHF